MHNIILDMIEVKFNGIINSSVWITFTIFFIYQTQLSFSWSPVLLSICFLFVLKFFLKKTYILNEFSFFLLQIIVLCLAFFQSSLQIFNLHFLSKHLSLHTFTLNALVNFLSEFGSQKCG